MAGVIRLSRCAGAKKRPFFWVVLTDKRKRRDSGFKHKLGYYNPLLNQENKLTISDMEKLKHYIACGVEISDTVIRLLKRNPECVSLVG